MRETANTMASMESRKATRVPMGLTGYGWMAVVAVLLFEAGRLGLKVAMGG
jgi:hypothetical protein